MDEVTESERSGVLAEVDVHTHTVISGHAFSTLLENIAYGKRVGLKGLVITEHGPATPGGAPAFIPHSQSGLPKMVEGLRIYNGAEINILDSAGTLDIPEKYRLYLDFALASMHIDSCTPSTVDENTAAMINALSDPCVDTIAHPENPSFQIDVEALVNAAKRLNKCLELNNHSSCIRAEGMPTAYRMITLCKEKGVRLTLGSDAHLASMVGDFSSTAHILRDTGYPIALIVNRTLESFERYLDERRNRIRCYLEKNEKTEPDR